MHRDDSLENAPGWPPALRRLAPLARNLLVIISNQQGSPTVASSAMTGHSMPAHHSLQEDIERPMKFICVPSFDDASTVAVGPWPNDCSACEFDRQPSVSIEDPGKTTRVDFSLH